MQKFYSPVDTYPFLKTLSFAKRDTSHRKHILQLQTLLQPVEWQPLPPETPAEVQAYLSRRETQFCLTVQAYVENEIEKLAKYHLQSQNSFEILSKHTRLLDAVIEVAFLFVVADFLSIEKNDQLEQQQQQRYKNKQLPEKKKN